MIATLAQRVWVAYGHGLKKGVVLMMSNSQMSQGTVVNLPQTPLGRAINVVRRVAGLIKR